jgi:hypothetical protein
MDAAPIESAQSGALSQRDREILAFERQWWKYAGAKEQAVRELFDMSATRSRPTRCWSSGCAGCGPPASARARPAGSASSSEPSPPVDLSGHPPSAARPSRTHPRRAYCCPRPHSSPCAARMSRSASAPEERWKTSARSPALRAPSTLGSRSSMNSAAPGSQPICATARVK